MSRDDIHHRMRTERGTPLTRYTFNLVDELATEPNAYYIKQMESKKILYPPLEQEYETVKKVFRFCLSNRDYVMDQYYSIINFVILSLLQLFEDRPIWSLNLIKFHTKIRLSSLKIIMPCLAIYMKDGPWRMLWVRFGYDPRKEPGARIYQTLDFRLRHTGIIKLVIVFEVVILLIGVGK